MVHTCTCGRNFENGQAFNGHKGRCKIHMAEKGKTPSVTKNLQKKGKPLSERNRLALADSMQRNPPSGRAQTEDAEIERRRKISQTMKGNKNWENSVLVSGRGKKGKYKGHYFASSWELAFIVYHLEKGLEFKRNWQRFEYFFNGERKYYIPDFVLPDNLYVEIKGYESLQWKAKEAQFPERLIVIGKTEISEYIEYCNAHVPEWSKGTVCKTVQPSVRI